MVLFSPPSAILPLLGALPSYRVLLSLSSFSCGWCCLHPPPRWWCCFLHPFWCGACLPPPPVGGAAVPPLKIILGLYGKLQHRVFKKGVLRRHWTETASGRADLHNSNQITTRRAEHTSAPLIRASSQVGARLRTKKKNHSALALQP